MPAVSRISAVADIPLFPAILTVARLPAGVLGVVGVSAVAVFLLLLASLCC